MIFNKFRKLHFLKILPLKDDPEKTCSTDFQNIILLVVDTILY